MRRIGKYNTPCVCVVCRCGSYGILCVIYIQALRPRFKARWSYNVLYFIYVALRDRTPTHTDTYISNAENVIMRSLHVLYARCYDAAVCVCLADIKSVYVQLREPKTILFTKLDCIITTCGGGASKKGTLWKNVFPNTFTRNFAYVRCGTKNGLIYILREVVYYFYFIQFTRICAPSKSLLCGAQHTSLTRCAKRCLNGDKIKM